MTTPNAELAYKVLDLAHRHEAHFNMGDWASGVELTIEDLVSDEEPRYRRSDGEPMCGTTACFAGWTAAQAGYTLVGSSSEVFKGNRLAGRAGDIAAGLLGITDEQADDLFFCDNEDIDEVVAEIFGPRPGGDPR
jgi:hypothetical protein